MGEPAVSSRAILEFKVEGNEIATERLQTFTWTAFVNGGYHVACRVHDPLWNILRTLATEKYLATGRKKSTSVKFKLKWDDLETDEREGILVDLKADGNQMGGILEFSAIDPFSYLLETGNADGSVFKGKIGGKKGVIAQVIKKYLPPDFTFEISETDDNEENLWYMMRQDPRTFIRSLLEWSSSLTKKKTHWIVASSGKKIIIKEQADLKGDPLDPENPVYHVNTKSSGANDVIEFEVLTDSTLTSFQTKIITQGLSAISGQYLDKITDKEEEKVFVKDKRTKNKINTKIKKDRGFDKPNEELNADAGFTKSGATAFMAVPEHNAGDVGKDYEKYIDGRARGMFLDMLNLMMRIKIVVQGDHKVHDSTKLGVSWVVLNWNDIDGKPYFLSGPWLVYGFKHIMEVSSWTTELYLARLDFNAEARKVGQEGLK